jgi:hypothetical protein
MKLSRFASRVKPPAFGHDNRPRAKKLFRRRKIKRSLKVDQQREACRRTPSRSIAGLH